jgi:GNAT superfamily N-acetyltransferase
MVSFRRAASDGHAATALLDEYFAFRAATFPGGAAAYRVTTPPPAEFAHPRGVFVIAEGENLAGEPADVGCGGIRRVDGPAATFEVKHLWIRPHVRGTGLGTALLAELEREARSLGATELVLDTNDSLDAAAALYASAGFERTAAYNDNPNATAWYRKSLLPSAADER